MQLELLFTIILRNETDIGVHALPVTNLKIFSPLLDKQIIFSFWKYIMPGLVHGPLF